MVYVEKGGEIIPKIIGRRPRAASPPTADRSNTSPSCPDLRHAAGALRGRGEALLPQSGRTAEPQIIGRIIHFIRRKALDIEGLGEETVELLYRQRTGARRGGSLRPARRTDWLSLPRLGEKSADNIIRSHPNVRSRCRFQRVLFGLGIRFVGETTAKYLAEHFRSLDAVMQCHARGAGRRPTRWGRTHRRRHSSTTSPRTSNRTAHPTVCATRGCNSRPKRANCASESAGGQEHSSVSGKFSRTAATR